LVHKASGAKQGWLPQQIEQVIDALSALDKGGRAQRGGAAGTERCLQLETFRAGSLSTVALEPTGYTEVAPFLGLTERATDRIVFTNSDEFAEDVKNRDAMRTVRGIDFDDLTGDDFRAISVVDGQEVNDFALRDGIVPLRVNSVPTHEWIRQQLNLTGDQKFALESA
jgi:hypothetical protein